MWMCLRERHRWNAEWAYNSSSGTEGRMATGVRQDTIRWDRDWHGLQGWREQHNGTFRGNRHGWHLGEEEEEQEEESGIILLTEGRRSEREAHSGGYTRACCCIWLLVLGSLRRRRSVEAGLDRIHSHSIVFPVGSGEARHSV